MAKKGCGPLGCRNKKIYLRHVNDQTPSTAVPTITVSKNAIPFGNGISFDSDLIDNFTVQGSNLTGNITATIVLDATNRFKINLVGNTTDADPISFVPASGTVPLTTVYSVFDVQDGVSASYTATIELSSPGAVTKTIALSGRILTKTTPYFEDFDAALVSVSNPPDQYKFPTGWTLPSAPYEPLTDIFVFDDGGVSLPYSSSVGGSGLRALVFLDGNIGLVSVTSAPFSTIGKLDLTLDFLMLRSSAAAPPDVTIEWSDDNLNWHVLAYTQIPNDDAWHTVNTINLPSGVENKANIYLRLSQVADGGGNFTVIDDITIGAYE